MVQKSFLFARSYVPLADRMSPVRIDEVLGQNHLTGKHGLIRHVIQQKTPVNLLLYGPSGSGKSVVANIIRENSIYPHISINACKLKKGEFKDTLLRIEQTRNTTVLFVDEIHRLNKLQQEFLLPFVEDGTIILVGTTAENPFYTVSKALLSRVIPCEFKKLGEDEIMEIIRHAISDRERGLGKFDVQIHENVIKSIARLADGDARRALNYIEAAVLPQVSEGKKAVVGMELFVQSNPLSKDEEYDIISAFIKSLRGSDAEAAVYWMLRLLDSGEDPRYLLRRMAIFAAEDVGIKNPMALAIVSSGIKAFEITGEKEGRLIMTMLALYLARSAKDNTVLQLLNACENVIKNESKEDVPPYLRHGKRKKGEYINPHIESQRSKAQKYISKKIKEKIQGGKK